MDKSTEFTEFLKHLNSLKADDWEKIFVLLPEMESDQDFGQFKGGHQLSNGAYIMPNMRPSSLVRRVEETLIELNIMPVYDWMNWEEGRIMLENRDYNYSVLDTLILCKLLTYMVRADRFIEGFLVNKFEEGVVLKVLKALKNNQSKSE